MRWEWSLYWQSYSVIPGNIRDRRNGLSGLFPFFAMGIATGCVGCFCRSDIPERGCIENLDFQYNPLCVMRTGYLAGFPDAGLAMDSRMVVSASMFFIL